MTPTQWLTIKVSLAKKRFATLTADLALFRCLSCDAALDLQQPDVSFPDRLLGVCPGCRDWHVLDMELTEEPGVMVRLPDPASLRTCRGPT